MAKETLISTTPAYRVNKTVGVTPEETQRSVGYQAPTPEMQEYIRRNIIEPTAQAYGVNPDTGEVTPFQALGYDPDAERKRRAAEMRLNDRKRKENAWYNAFAVVGDSLTAGLGGNVWQRQPNRIGEKANADNQRLIAEQKAEDMNNAAIMRNAGVKYADAVNRLIQNYLTKTTTTRKAGGSRVETTDHPRVVSTREVLDYTGNNGRGGRVGSHDNHEEFRFGNYRYLVPKSRLNNTIDRLYDFIRRTGTITDDDLIKVQGDTDSKKLDANSKRQLVVNKMYEMENNPELFARYKGDIARELNWGALDSENIIRVPGATQPSQRKSGRLNQQSSVDKTNRNASR